MDANEIIKTLFLGYLVIVIVRDALALLRVIDGLANAGVGFWRQWRFGHTPLGVASAMNYTTLARLCLACGADIHRATHCAGINRGGAEFVELFAAISPCDHPAASSRPPRGVVATAQRRRRDHPAASTRPRGPLPAPIRVEHDGLLDRRAVLISGTGLDAEARVRLARALRARLLRRGEGESKEGGARKSHGC